MGTQQILLIVLAVIIVGVAIVVGISLFGNAAYNSNKQAVSADLNNYASQVIQFWKTPASLGGGGNKPANLTQAKIAAYITFTGADFSASSDNGDYRITAVVGNIVTLKGLGKEEKGGQKPLITTNVDVASSAISSVAASGTGF